MPGEGPLIAVSLSTCQSLKALQKTSSAVACEGHWAVTGSPCHPQHLCGHQRCLARTSELGTEASALRISLCSWTPPICLVIQ